MSAAAPPPFGGGLEDLGLPATMEVGVAVGLAGGEGVGGDRGSAAALSRTPLPQPLILPQPPGEFARIHEAEAAAHPEALACGVPGRRPGALVYPLDNYRMESKEPRLDKYRSAKARHQHHAEQYLKWGMRRTVEGLLLTHIHGHPHVFVMELKNNKFFKLPGGRLRPGEDEISGLRRKLNNKLAPEGTSIDWQIGELVCQFWKPSFDGNTYPYLPPHITLPKERKRVFMVALPERLALAVPSNYSLKAVPLFDLYENAQLFGSVIAHLPASLSRFQLTITK